MPYGTIKCDNITFDNGGTDKLLTVSGLFFSTSGALTVTGAISGGNVTAPTATFTTFTGTTTAGTTATFTSGSFTSLTGVTTTVTSGIFGAGSATDPSVAVGTGTTNRPGIYSPGTDQLAISTSGTGRITVDASGRLLVGTSSTASAGGVSAQHAFSHGTSSQWVAAVQHTTGAGNTPFGLTIKYTAATPNDTSSDFLFCEDATALRARIYSNGGLGNYQANNVNLSDRNTKKDISPAADTWNCIKEWEIVNYRYKDQPDDADLNLGVIAQQVAESCPEVITIFEEAKDDQPEKLGVKEQQMYWMAIKALQEGIARIETLEARLTAAGIE